MRAIDRAPEPPTLVGLLDELLDGGVHVSGDVVIGLADVDLIRVALRLLVASEETAQRTGTSHHKPARHPATPADPPEHEPPVASSSHQRPQPAQPPSMGRHPIPAQKETDSSIEAADREALVGGVSRLVLTVVEVIRELIERQAVRRVEAGNLTNDEVERLGVALQALEERMAEVKEVFGMTDEDLNLDLGPLGRLR